MLNNSLRATSRIKHGLRSLKSPCYSPRTSQSTTPNHQIHRLGTNCTVRSINIRRVIDGYPDKHRNTAQVRQKALPKVSPVQGWKKLYKDVDFRKVDVDTWLDEIPLPPDTYWETWIPVLPQLYNTGPFRAKKTLESWRDGLATSYRGQRHLYYKAREIIQCTGCFSMPLLGDRVVVAYGYTKKEAINNLYPVLVSTLYKSGDLDTVFKGTVASRRLIAIYEQAAGYGLFPRFKLSMSNDQPGAHFQITLSVPEWNVQVLASAPTYVEALSKAIDSYQDKVKKRDVKTKLNPEVTESRMKDLKSATSYHALKYLLRRLHITRHEKKYRKLTTAAPRHIYDIWIDGRLSNAEVPMIRQTDARKMANLTAVVTVLQRYGFDTIDGFTEYFQAINLKKASAESKTVP